MQMDIGFGDANVPRPIWIDYPKLLELDEMNSRMKDCYDVWWLSRHRPFEGHRPRAAWSDPERPNQYWSVDFGQATEGRHRSSDAEASSHHLWDAQTRRRLPGR